MSILIALLALVGLMALAGLIYIFIGPIYAIQN